MIVWCDHAQGRTAVVELRKIRPLTTRSQRRQKRFHTHAHKRSTCYAMPCESLSLHFITLGFTFEVAAVLRSAFFVFVPRKLNPVVGTPPPVCPGWCLVSCTETSTEICMRVHLHRSVSCTEEVMADARVLRRKREKEKMAEIPV